MGAARAVHSANGLVFVRAGSRTFALVAALATPPVTALAQSSGQVGGLRAEITAAPDSFDYRRTPEMRYVLTFTTGAGNERFAIKVVPPFFPGLGGTPFLEPRVAWSGPAARGYGLITHANIACSSYNVIHGAHPVGVTWDIIAPASDHLDAHGEVRHLAPRCTVRRPARAARALGHARARLASRRRSGDHPPRPQAAAAAAATRRPLGRADQHAHEAAHLARPAGKYAEVSPRPELPRLGSTRPILRRQVIPLRALTPGRLRPPRLIARVRANGRGRFSYGWRPRKPGTHQLLAFYRRQQHGVTSDLACLRVVEIRRR